MKSNGDAKHVVRLEDWLVSVCLEMEIFRGFVYIYIYTGVRDLFCIKKNVKLHIPHDSSVYSMQHNKIPCLPCYPHYIAMVFDLRDNG